MPESSQSPASTPTPTAIDAAVTPGSVNLRGLETLMMDPAKADAPALPNPSPALTPAANPPPVETGPGRDALGRFTAAPAPVPAAPDRVEATPGVGAEAAPASPPPVPAATAASSPAPITGRADFEKRLAKERAKRGDAERRAEELETRLAALERAASPPAAPTARAPVFPTYDTYLTEYPEASYEDYLDARTEARVEARVLAERQSLEATARTHAVAGALQQIMTLGPQRHADFEAVQTAAFEAEQEWAPHLSEFVLRYTASAEEAADVTYALLKDTALVERINALPPARAAFELGRLLLTVRAAPNGSAPPSHHVTQAPAPMQPVGTQAATAPISADTLAKETRVHLGKFGAALR